MPTTLDLTDAEIDARLAAFPDESLTTPCEVPEHPTGGVTRDCKPEQTAEWHLLIYHVRGAESCSEPVHLLVCDGYFRALQLSPAPEICPTCRKTGLRAADFWTLIGKVE